MKRIKIAHLITDLDIGGAELMLLKVLRNSDRKLYDHFVISLKSKGKVAKGIEDIGVWVINLDVKWYNFPLGLIKLCAILKKEKPAILHNYLFHADLAGRICGRISGVPAIVSSLRSVDVGSGFREILLRTTDGLVDAVTAVSKKVAQEHINKRTTKEAKVRIIYNGLELDNSNKSGRKDELRGKEGIAPGEFLILSVGNLRPVKGYSFIFDAVKVLQEKVKDVKLVIVGGGDYKKALEAEITHKGVSG
ncbi:MAG: glycosyltransferase, partial [Candidatus Omnitrophica bacterium]|nr:glycosyltransferase [Candidatus Omnitrophota bacterium]